MSGEKKPGLKVVPPADAEATEVKAPSYEEFLSDLGEVINFHSKLTYNELIGGLIQAACQLAIQGGVKMKVFMQSTQTYYIQIRRNMRKSQH